MTFYISPAELTGLNEQELRALHGRILADMRRNGQSAFLCPMLMESLGNINSALLRLQQPGKPHGPRPPRP